MCHVHILMPCLSDPASWDGSYYFLSSAWKLNSHSLDSSLAYSTHLRGHFLLLSIWIPIVETHPINFLLTFPHPCKLSTPVNHLRIEFPHLRFLSHCFAVFCFGCTFAHHVSAHITTVTHWAMPLPIPCLLDFSMLWGGCQCLPTKVSASKPGVKERWEGLYLSTMELTMHDSTGSGHPVSHSRPRLIRWTTSWSQWNQSSLSMVKDT